MYCETYINIAIIAHCAFQHHERLDGSGYPRGLLDFEIHPYAKIIAVADVFDAVTSNRVYRDKCFLQEEWKSSKREAALYMMKRS